MGSQTVHVGDAVIAVDDHRPAAVVHRPDARDITVVWPDLDVGWCTPTLTVLASADAAWAVYRLTDIDSALRSHDDAASIAVRIAVDGAAAVVHVPSDSCIGVTRRGLWTARDDRLNLTMFAVDAAPHTMSSNRPVTFVLDGDDGGNDVVISYADASRRGRSAVVQLPASEPLPDVLPTDTAVDVDDETLYERLRALLPVRTDGVARDWAWRTVMPPQDLQHHAVAEALRQFEVIEPFTPGRTDYPAQPDHVARVEGGWPDTVVALELPHPDVPSARLRREHRVFDASGRIVPVGYLSVYVMEDIHTGKYPTAAPGDVVVF